ncbi:DUF4221 family protein [Roseivirga misakiensis]|uniref:DUF4221 domain-containing protein n=1 Tax=Roseivirga misakiensis TaxID=1563681 RepID=A0A1E5T4T4_9BACT|nr:DUF4221 family protein [Roseivirga misakiensis]OEK06371.1 hypothetical protein BFP71_01460 [Roseivirga misakiensis]
MSKTRFNFYIFLTCLLVCSCGKNDRQEIVKASSQEGELVFKVDTVKVDIGDQISYTYFRFDTYEEEGRFYFVKYQGSQHALLFYDLEKRRLSKTIALEKAGPNGIGTLQNFHVHNLDSIFVFDAGNMKVLSEDAEVFFSMNLFSQLPQGVLIDFASPESKPFYSSKLNRVILENSLRRNATAEEKNQPFLAAINLESKSFELIGPQHAPFMKNAKVGYGSYQGISFTNHENLIFYNYPVSSKVYSYDLLTKENKAFNGNVSSIPNQASEFKNAASQAFINAYRFETAIFYNIIYDPYKELFYRLHRTGKPYDPAVRNTIQNTRFYVSVFGREMNFIKEIEVAQNTYSQYTAFVGPEGLFLNASFKEFPLLEEDKMIFHVYDFSFQ